VLRDAMAVDSLDACGSIRTTGGRCTPLQMRRQLDADVRDLRRCSRVECKPDMSGRVRTVGLFSYHSDAGASGSELRLIGER